MQGDLAACIDKKSGQILVNEFGQVTNCHPLTKVGQPANPTVHKNIFSYGDVTLTPRAEMKCIVSMLQYGSVIAGNLVEVANGTVNLTPMPHELHKIQIIPLGSKSGLFVFNGTAKVDPNAINMKIAIRDNNIGFWKGDQAIIERRNQTNAQFGKYMQSAQGCCVCLPMHISKVRGENQRKLQATVQEYDKIYS